MIHVQNVRKAVDWYKSIGFRLVRSNEDHGEMDWAKLTFGNSELMFSAAGKPSVERRREVDLYITTNDVDEIFRSLENRVEIVEQPYDAFYGMHEFTIRDCNGFWITFGQPAKA